MLIPPINSRSLRLAYRLLRVAALEDRIQLLLKKYPQINEYNIKNLLELDPTNGKFLEWLVRQFLDGFNLLNYMKLTNNLLKTYLEIKKSPFLLKHYEINPDINKYNIKTLNESISPLIDEDLSSKADIIRKARSTTQVVYDKDPYKILKIEARNKDELGLAAEMACKYARGTKWCTSGKFTAENYLEKRNLYIIFINGVKTLQTDGVMFATIEDKTVSVKDSDDLLLACVEAGVFDKPAKRDNRTIFYYLVYHLDVELQKTPKLLDYLMENEIFSPKDLLLYAESKSLDSWPQAEPFIMRNPRTAAQYAKYILGRRWPEAERVIATDPKEWRDYRDYFHDDFKEPVVHARKHSARNWSSAQR